MDLRKVVTPNSSTFGVVSSKKEVDATLAIEALFGLLLASLSIEVIEDVTEEGAVPCIGVENLLRIELLFPVVAAAVPVAAGTVDVPVKLELLFVVDWSLPLNIAHNMQSSKLCF